MRAVLHFGAQWRWPGAVSPATGRPLHTTTTGTPKANADRQPTLFPLSTLVRLLLGVLRLKATPLGLLAPHFLLVENPSRCSRLLLPET